MFKQVLRLETRKKILNDFFPKAPSVFLSQNTTNSNLNNHVIDPYHSKMSYRIADNTGLHLLYDTVAYRIDTLANSKPNNECYIFPVSDTRLTFSELKQRVDGFAQNLLNLGFQKGDRLAIMLPNILELNISILAAASIGVMVVLMNPAYKLVEIEYMLKKTKARGIIILENTKSLQHYDILNHICPELSHTLKGGLVSRKLPDLKHIITANLKSKYKSVPDRHYRGAWSFSELEKFNLKPIERPYVEAEDSFALIFTSGTTGVPKAATISQFSLLNTVHLGSTIQGSFESLRNVCSPIPIFHIFGLVIGCLSPIVIANKTVIPSYFPDTLATMKAIQEEKCTALNGAPVIFSDILNHPKRKDYNFKSLEMLVIGASNVTKKLIYKLKSELGTKNVIIGYGMTESSSAGTLTKCKDALESDKHAYESIGTPYPFTECKVVDSASGKIVPHNVDGELYMRGYHLMKEYWEGQIKTSETIDNNKVLEKYLKTISFFKNSSSSPRLPTYMNWLKTGDIVSMDSDGYFYFKSRAKEIVIRGGMNIFPAEIEGFLISHDAICGVHCFGYPDERNGEELCAWIILKEGVNNVTANDLLEYCKDKIAYFKIPKYIKFVSSFPMNVHGKVIKDEMRQQMLNDLQNLPVKNLFKIN